jgi:hypothetical protein
MAEIEQAHQITPVQERNAEHAADLLGRLLPGCRLFAGRIADDNDFACPRSVQCDLLDKPREDPHGSIQTNLNVLNAYLEVRFDHELVVSRE